MFDINCLKFDENGLVPGIVQTPGGEVHHVGSLDRQAVETMLKTGFVSFWGPKGETYGKGLKLLELRPEGNQNALVIIADPDGPTCSCFEGDPLPQPWLERLEILLRDRKAHASLEGSYTQKLFARGVDRIAKKVVEESGEVIIAAKNYELDPSSKNREEYLGEAADLLFHLQVLLVAQGFSLKDIAKVLQERHRQRS